MSLHASLSPVAINNRIFRDQTTSRKPTLLQTLEAAFSVSEGMCRYALAHDLGDRWTRGYRMSLDLAEQIAIVKQLEAGKK